MYEEVLMKESEETNASRAQIEAALDEIKRVYRIIPCKKYLPGIDYNISPYRCAYMYYFGYYHTAMVESVLIKFRQEKENKFNEMMMYDESKMSVCSLGGGPGFDLVGVLNVRSLNNFALGCTKRLQCTVLDLCRGWEVSLRHVRRTFLKSVGSIYNGLKVFNFDLIEANLSSPLNPNVKKIIEEADILNMVKFVSAVPFMGKRNTEYLQRIFASMKKKAFVFFIDNINGNFYNMVATAAEKSSLNLVWTSLSKELTVKIPAFRCCGIKGKHLKGTSVVVAIWQKRDS